MHNEMITWDALLMTKWVENNQKRTVWERKQFTAPDSKDTAYAIAVKTFESSNVDVIFCSIFFSIIFMS